MTQVLYAAVDPAEKARLGKHMSRLRRGSHAVIVEECEAKWSIDGANCVLAANTKKGVRKCAFW